MSLIFRPFCWVAGHLWELPDDVWLCDRCGKLSRTKPEGW